MKRIAIAVLLAIVLAGGYAGYRIVWGQPFTINQLANRQALQGLVRNPELFTTIGIADGSLLDFHSGRLTEFGVARRDADYAFAEHVLAEVKDFDRGKLDHADQITYDVLVDFYGTPLAMRPFAWLSSEGVYPISPMFGPQIGLVNFMQTQHVVTNEKTARNYVKRLQAMGPKLDALTSEMRRQSDAGLVLPPALLEKSLVVIDDTIAPKPADNPLITTFTTRMQPVGDLDKSTRNTLRDDAVAILESGIYPAYQRMRAALIEQRPRAATTAAGIGRMPDGGAYYQAALRQYTTTDYTPEQVHGIGLSEVARIQSDMDTLLRSQGLDTGSVGVRMTALGKDPRMLFPDTDAGREQALARYREILDQVALRMPDYFRDVPAAKLRVERVPTSAEKGSAQAYYQMAALDGSRAATFFANLRDLTGTPVYAMKTVAYHEGIPGHHFQISAAQNLKNLPVIRQLPLYAAYTEGWALYAEQLAAEIGMYKDDPYGDLGRLQDELFRAVRLVVDSGLHAKGWTREQAIDYMVATTGKDPADVVSEIERYMALPGQACSYKIGQIKILELRERARKALGPKFDIRDFHATVLGNGTVPLTILERLVDEWIKNTT